MSIQLLINIAFVLYVISGVFFILAVILFFVFKIPNVYNDISGRAAKKAINEIRYNNENYGKKSNHDIQTNNQRSKLTEKISRSGNLKFQTLDLSSSVVTEKITTNKLNKNNETTLLNKQNSNETTLLNNNYEYGETDILPNINNIDFTLDVEISFSESDIVIE